MSHAMITANRLRDGVAVWRAADGGWVERFADGAVWDDAAAESALAEARGDIARQLVVGVYKATVSLRAGKPVPGNERERIRSRGPSVRLDLGIQAEAGI